MSAQLAGLRPQRFALATYRAFRLDQGRASEIALQGPAELNEAIAAAVPALIYKDTLAIRETDEAGDRVHIFAIRKRAPRWVHPAGEFVPRRVEDLFADPVTTVPAEVFG